MVEGGTVDEVSLSLSLKRLRGGGRGGAPSLGTLEDTFGRSPDKGISVGTPLSPRGSRNKEGGARLPGTLMDG